MWTLFKCKGQLIAALSCRLYCRIVSKSNHSNNRAWHVICVWKQEPLQCTYSMCRPISTQWTGIYVLPWTTWSYLSMQSAVKSNQIKFIKSRRTKLVTNTAI